MSKVLSSSALLGFGVAVGTLIYHFLTRGVGPDTWYKSAFVGGFVFLIVACVLGLKGRLWPRHRDRPE
jgi:hypothetical protein